MATAGAAVSRHPLVIKMALVICGVGTRHIYRQLKNAIALHPHAKTTEVKSIDRFVNIKLVSPSFVRCLYLTSTNCKESPASSKDETKQEKSIAPTHENPYSHLTLGGKVKQATKDVSYIAIIIAGISVTAALFYAIFRELFSSSSPNNIYTEAFKMCKRDPKIIDAIGEPIKGYGELTSRGRRRHVSHLEYVQDGINHMRMRFYIEGSRRKGTVHLDVQENEKGKYEYRYLFVNLDGFPKQTIILQDNR